MGKGNSNSSPWLDADTIKKSVPIETVLDRYGLKEKLKARGHQLVGKSPFRDETKPSFSVNLDKGVWNDFGGMPEVDGRLVPGNVIGLVMAMEPCSFRRALEILAGGAGETRQELGKALQGEGERQQQKRTEDVAVKENKPFGKTLDGLRAQGVPYFEGKGITDETVKAFGAGYCSKGMMKSRVAFPIRNAEGVVMAYAGRAILEGQEPYPYKFPPGFRKQLELFNIDRIASDMEAIEAVKRQGLIVVEGFTDVMKLVQEGFSNVVALMGCALGDAQKAMLIDPQLNPTKRLTLFFDNDEAGRKGRKRAAGTLIHDAFIRYVDYDRVPKGHHVEEPTEPEHFTAEEFRILLA